MTGMPAQRSFGFALVAGLLLAALAGCGGSGNASASSPKGQATANAKPAVPTTAAQVQGHLFSVVNRAASVHVKGSYTWPHSRLTVNVGLFQSGQMAGFMDDDGLPMPMIDIGGKMYVKVTPAAAAYYHRGCAPACGKYAIYPRSGTAGLIRTMGMKSTLNTLMQMADFFLSRPIHTNFHGQPALQAMASRYGRGAYVIVAATPEALPLEAVDPGHFKLTFSKWNGVPAPHAPPKSKIYTVPL
jgi:hypothetical protein